MIYRYCAKANSNNTGLSVMFGDFRYIVQNRRCENLLLDRVCLYLDGDSPWCRSIRLCESSPILHGGWHFVLIINPFFWIVSNLCNEYFDIYYLSTE